MIPALTVIDSKVVKTMIPDSKRPGKRKPYVVGIRIDMADGSWYFWARKHKTWTKHEPGLKHWLRSGSPMLDEVTGEQKQDKERITRYGTETQFRRTMGHCTRLMNALDEAMATAA